MSHALFPNKWTPPCSAKSGPRSSVLEATAACAFAVAAAPRGHEKPFHVDVMQHTVSDVIHNQCGYSAML
jgi:hypothetical protein